MIRSMLAAAVAATLWAGSATAATLYDSGTPLSSTMGASVSSDQWLAVLLVAEDLVTITDVEFWAKGEGLNEVQLHIWADDGGAPGMPGTEFFREGVALDPTDYAWQGSHGLFVNLAPGRYWFGVSIQDQSSVFLGGALGGTIANGARWAVRDPAGWRRTLPIGTGQGVRINGTGPSLTTAVPEPQSWALMILGFGAAGAVLRRRPSDVHA